MRARHSGARYHRSWVGGSERAERIQDTKTHEISGSMVYIEIEIGKCSEKLQSTSQYNRVITDQSHESCSLGLELLQYVRSPIVPKWRVLLAPQACGWTQIYLHHGVGPCVLLMPGIESALSAQRCS